MTFLKYTIIMFFMMFLALNCKASDIFCSYNFENDHIIVKTKEKVKTITKKYTKNNLFYEYRIKDINNFNELDDYISISNTKGHKITYYLKCYKK